MSGQSKWKPMYDDIAARYFKTKGYEIETVGGGGGAKPDVRAKKGSKTAFVEVKSPAETGCGGHVYTDMGEEQYLGGIERTDLWEKLSPLLSQYPGMISLVKLYIATIQHEMYHAYLNDTATDDRNNNVEIYLCTPKDNEQLPITEEKEKNYPKNQYEAATLVALEILKSIKFISLVSTDKYREEDVYCIGIYQFSYNNIPKEEAEENIKEAVDKAKASNPPKPISPSPRRSFRIPGIPVRIPVPAIPIDPETLGIIAGAVLLFILVWWLFSHFSWTSDKAASFSKKEEATPIAMSTTIPIPEPLSIPLPEPIYLEPIYFQLDKYDIDAELTARLISLADDIKKSSPALAVDVDGYTCNIGSASYNLKLSENRANTVKSLLIANGVPSNSVRIIPRGIAPDNNEAEEGRMKNRRADITVSMPDTDVIESDDKHINTDDKETVSARQIR